MPQTRAPTWTEKGERNDDGELVYTKVKKKRSGETTELEINLSKLLSPGERNTANEEILRIEAELVADGVELGNPATPTNHRVAKRVIENLESDGLQPAWRVCERREYP